MDLSKKSLWVFDVDNTMILDVEHPTPFEDALKLWKALEKKGVTLAILTNVGRLSSRQVHQAVTKAGFHLPLENVYTAGAAAAAYVHNRKPGARCFVISEGGAQEDFIARGLDVTNNPPIDYVAVGADRGMTFHELNFATKMVKNGAPIICISGSRDYPGIYLGHEDMYIGERSIVAALEHATGTIAVTVGKPLPEIMLETVKILGFEVADSVMVGDNPRSDIAGGNAAGMTTILVQRDPDNIVDFESGDLDTTPTVTVESLDELIPKL
ncbi:MAG: HAD hydrolase-like protein [Candidatus Thorarchaeota archaeon]|nr:HAD hydrolase-like protein [Candidatus Thorarchaeota archaeon]